MKVKKMKERWAMHIPWKYLLCVLGMVLLCGFSGFQGNPLGTDEISLYAWLHYSRQELLQMGELASDYSVMSCLTGMQWFVVILPVLAAFPAVTDFAGQWFGGYYYPSISRTTRRKYAAKWMMKAAWQGFACVVAGILIYFILVYLKFPHYGEFGLEADNSMIAMAYGATAGKRLLVLALKVFHIGLLAAVFSMGSVALTVVCKEGFFAISSLALVEYFSQKLSSAYEGLMIVRYYNKGLEDVPLSCKLVRFLFPSNHLYYDQSFSYEYGVGYWLYLIFAGLLIAGICLWFYKMVKGRNG